MTTANITPTTMNSTFLSLNSHPDRLFFGESGHGIARYDVVRYPELAKLNKTMRSKFWEPEVIPMDGERRSFQSMTDPEKFCFTENIKRQVLLDTVQGRAPSQVFKPWCTDPTLDNCLTTWEFMETIHSESYTHILRAIYPDPSVVVDAIPDIREIADCAVSISLAYDRMIANPNKENLYLALIAANALESIRFYVSFACTFNFKERKLVSGSGDTTKLIARDEALHLALVQRVLKLLPKDDPEFVQIIADNQTAALQIFQEAADQEKSWAAHMFSRGPFLGLTTDILCNEVDYRHYTQVAALGLPTTGLKRTTELPYMRKYTSDSNSIQGAPQEDGALEYLSASSLANDLGTYKPVLRPQ